MSETLVWTDQSVGDDSDRAANPHLALHAVGFGEDWNGWKTPIVTAAEFRRYLSAHSANDGNSTWDDLTVIEGDGALIIEDLAYDDRSIATVCGIVDGVPVYCLDVLGWTFEL